MLHEVYVKALLQEMLREKVQDMLLELLQEMLGQAMDAPELM